MVLQSVTLSSSGRYRCEVSGEAPSFNTVDGYGDMVVVGEFPNFMTNVKPSNVRNLSPRLKSVLFTLDTRTL